MPLKHQPDVQTLDTTKEKCQLRFAYRQAREMLGKATRQQASTFICGWIKNWSVFQNSSVILPNMPITSEVDLTQLLIRQSKKHWYLPRFIPEENHCMVFFPMLPSD